MGLALAGLATLWMAITADMGASLLVIFNSLRLLDAKSGEADSCQLSAVSRHPLPPGN
jgi:cation transport ATPase